eukprot:18469-Heterococcus_DN1.PRE.1
MVAGGGDKKGGGRKMPNSERGQFNFDTSTLISFCSAAYALCSSMCHCAPPTGAANRATHVTTSLMVITCAIAGVEGAKGKAKFLEKQQASEMSRLQALAQRMLG